MVKLELLKVYFGTENYMNIRPADIMNIRFIINYTRFNTWFKGQRDRTYFAKFLGFLSTFQMPSWRVSNTLIITCSYSDMKSLLLHWIRFKSTGIWNKIYGKKQTVIMMKKPVMLPSFSYEATVVLNKFGYIFYN